MEKYAILVHRNGYLSQSRSRLSEDCTAREQVFGKNLHHTLYTVWKLIKRLKGQK
jgi:hypothetical protein